MRNYTGIDLLLADFKSMKGEYGNGEQRRVILKVPLRQGVTKENKEVDWVEVTENR